MPESPARKALITLFDAAREPPGSPPGPPLGANQPLPDGVADQPGRLVDVELGHDPYAVRLGRLHAHAEEGGDLLGRLPFRDELEDLMLSRRQWVGREVSLCQVRLDHGLRYAGAQVD